MESLIAMVIIIICFGTATMIWSNVLSSDKQRIHLKASLLLNAEAIQIRKEKNFVDDQKKIDDWIIIKKVEPYKNTENLFVLTLSVTDQEGKKLFTRNELIAIE